MNSQTNAAMAFGISRPGCVYIGGKWVEPAVGAYLELVSPDTDEGIGRVAAAGAADVDRACAAAREAFDTGPWPRMSPSERADAVARMAELLERRTSELAAVWTAQTGGMPFIATPAAGLGHANFHRAIALARSFPFEEPTVTQAAASALLVREPVGVVVAIAPWNGPYLLMSAKVAPALVAGCTVIMKPAPETPLEAYIIAECAEAAGIPPGVINLITADRYVADLLVRDPRVDKVAFTGSTTVGRHIAAVCGERLARCTLELGGKSAAIVLDDFAITDAAKLLTGTITLMSGQICSMLSRVIVTQKRHDELAEAIAAEMKAVRVGHCDDPQSMMGPLASRRQLERVERLVQAGRDAGTRLITGGRRPDHMDRGCFYEPTLFAGADSASVMAQEEIFGPVLTLIPCRDENHAVRIANDSRYGLHGAVLSHDAQAVYRIGRQVRAGTFAQNGMKTDFALPFGGVKESRIGREGGIEGLMGYLDTKAMLFDSPKPPTGPR